MQKYELIIYLKLAVIPIIIFVSLLVWIYFKNYGSEQTLEIEVKEKYIKNYTDDSKYIVIAKNGNAYEISDTIFRLKFNSTDLFGMIDIGKQYKITVTGYRIHLFSMYPNIHEIVEIANEGGY